MTHSDRDHDGDIVTVEGPALHDLREALARYPTGIYRIRIEQRPGGVAIKFNEDTWSPTLATTYDPS